MSIPLLVSATVLENIELMPRYFRMQLVCPQLAGSVVPGQFLHVRVAERLDIILRRPFSVFDFDENTVSIMYEVVGKGTGALSLKKPGEELDILGPLGNGFSIGHEINKAVLVGGGIGIAPLFCWAKKLKREGRNIDVLIGTKNRYKVLCEEDFRKIGILPKISTEDGSSGYKGMVTDLLREQCAGYDTRCAVIYACGPFIMLKELSGIAKEKNISCQMSLDRHMGCGLGACLGCVVKAQDGKYKRVCKDGPVFNADEIDWS